MVVVVVVGVNRNTNSSIIFGNVVVNVDDIHPDDDDDNVNDRMWL